MLTWKDVLDRAQRGNPSPPRRVERSDADWKARLTPEQYHVTRQHGTERVFSSEMCSRFEPGRYACICCDTLLFDGTAKFESVTGWPSFSSWPPLMPSRTPRTTRTAWCVSRPRAARVMLTSAMCSPTVQPQAACGTA